MSSRTDHQNPVDTDTPHCKRNAAQQSDAHQTGRNLPGLPGRFSQSSRRVVPDWRPPTGSFPEGGVFPSCCPSRVFPLMDSPVNEHSGVCAVTINPTSVAVLPKLVLCAEFARSSSIKTTSSLGYLSHNAALKGAKVPAASDGRRSCRARIQASPQPRSENGRVTGRRELR